MQMVRDAAGLGGSAAAQAMAAGLRRVDPDGVGLAAAPAAAARRTRMSLDEVGSADMTVTAGSAAGDTLDQMEAWASLSISVNCVCCIFDFSSSFPALEPESDGHCPYPGWKVTAHKIKTCAAQCFSIRAFFHSFLDTRAS